MNKIIRHRRLEAFYKSKVLNSMMILAIVSLLQIPLMPDNLTPIVCSAIAFAVFIGYSLWLWIRKPQTIVINGWLSDINGALCLYFLAVVAMKAANEWWYIAAAIMGVLTLIINLIKPKDEPFEISA